MSGVNVHVFRESVAKVVRALTDSNIKVRQQGSKAYVDYDGQGRPNCVTLPSIPDNAPADLLNAIQGFLDHEVSHVLHTDFALSARKQRECAAAGDKVRPALWNVIEDVYVEQAMTKRFTGSMVNIDNVQRFITGKMLNEGFAKLKGEGADDSKLRSYLMPAAVRAAAGQPAFVDFMKDKWDVMGHMEKGIKDLGDQIRNIKSTNEAWGMTDKLYEVVKQPKPPMPPSDAPPQKGDGNGSGKKKEKSENDENQDNDNLDSGDEKGEKSKSSKSKPKPEPKPKKEEGDKDEDKGKDEKEPKPEPDSEEESKPEPESKDENEEEAPGTDDNEEEESKGGKGDDKEEEKKEEENKDGEGSGADDAPEEEPEDPEEEEEGDGADGDADENEEEEEQSEPGDADEPHKTNGRAASAPGEPTGGDSDDADAETASIEDLIDPDLIKPLDDAAAELIEKEIAEHRAASPSDYVPYSRDYDYVGPLPTAELWQSKSLDESPVAKSATETAHVIQGEVERIFRARSATRWNPGQRKGKINRGSLHRVCIGDDRVFRTKIEAQNRDIAVQLVIDCSGSMYGEKVQYAATAAYMLASVLERINVNCEIVGFTTMAGEISEHLKMPDWRTFKRTMTEDRDANYYSKGPKYARYDPICLYVFKDFAKRFDDYAKKTLGFLQANYGFMRNNVDGESIEVAAMRLQQRKEARKVMIVMSDGQPACDGDMALGRSKLKQVVEDIGRSNIEIYGLGLLDASVKSYYPKCEIIGSAKEIPTKVLALIQQLLVN